MEFAADSKQENLCPSLPATIDLLGFSVNNRMFRYMGRCIYFYIFNL